MQAGEANKQNLKLPLGFFILQITGAVLLFSVLVYIRGGAARSKLISMLPLFANQDWVWLALVAGLLFVGFAARVFIASAAKGRARP